MELPFDRRPLWLNRLTNERFFGVLAMDPASEGSALRLDGEADDWSGANQSSWQYPALSMSAVHDEAYLYLMLRKRGGYWDFRRDRLYLGFSTLTGGSRTADQAPGLTFSHPMQFLLRVMGEDDARLFVQSAYDQHTYRWGVQQPILATSSEYADPAMSLFLPWKLLTNRAIQIPSTGEVRSTEEVEIGKLRRGTYDSSAPDSDDLADWQARGDTFEIRIPWMLLGFMDPSSQLVWDWPYIAHGIAPAVTDALRIEPRLVTDGMEVANEGPAASYRWKGWTLPVYRERLKASYSIMSQAMAQCDLPQPRREAGQTSLPSMRAFGDPATRYLPLTAIRPPAWRRSHPKRSTPLRVAVGVAIHRWKDAHTVPPAGGGRGGEYHHRDGAWRHVSVFSTALLRAPPGCAGNLAFSTCSRTKPGFRRRRRGRASLPRRRWRSQAPGGRAGGGIRQS